MILTFKIILIAMIIIGFVGTIGSKVKHEQQNMMIIWLVSVIAFVAVVYIT